MRRYLPELGIAVRITLMIMVAVGLIYPLVMTGVAQGLFHDRAEGSLVKQNGQVVGSSLIGQSWTSDQYFHGRPSATLDANGTPQPDNAANSSASNLGPTNPVLIAAVQSNADAVRCLEGLPPGPPPLVTPAPATPSPTPAPNATPGPEASPTATPAPCAAVSQPEQQLPVDAVTASGSGLDPDISVAYARLQVPRIAAARNLQPDQVQKLIDANILDRQLGVLGERRVNVLRLNLALDKLAPTQ
jgi:K+-transporting ATPase ATPase C chain